MIYKTTQDLVYAIAKRVKTMGNEKMEILRSETPISTETQAECIRYSYEAKLKRGDIMEWIIKEEFSEAVIEE